MRLGYFIPKHWLFKRRNAFSLAHFLPTLKNHQWQANCLSTLKLNTKNDATVAAPPKKKKKTEVFKIKKNLVPRMIHIYNSSSKFLHNLFSLILSGLYEFHHVLSDYSIWMRVFAYWESTINLTYDVIKNILTVASKEGIW